MKHSRNDHLKSELSKIGKNSLFLIESIEKTSSKGETWEKAVEINKIAHSLYKELSQKDSPLDRRDFLPNVDAIKEAKGWEDYYNNPYLQ